MRKVDNFNTAWRFTLGDATEYAGKDFDDSQWRVLNLPHDWSIELELKEDAATGGGGGFAEAGIGWYRKSFSLEDVREDEDITILFDGVYMSSTVYLNGEQIVSHPYGYTSFVAELTSRLVQGTNVLAVRVDNSRQPNSRWYSGSGIYRNVSLIRTGKVHFDLWGLQYDTNGIYPTQNIASLQLRATLVNNSD